MMKLDIYINYPGHCEEAFNFYAEQLGGKVTFVSRHGSDAGSNQLPPEFNGKVQHARMDLGDSVLMGADVPNAEPMRSAYLTLTLDSVEEADRVYALLSDRGEVFMKMEETFFARRFAMLRDRFGTSWMLLCETEVEAGASRNSATHRV
jgi:PhnB protein